ncbi:TPA: chlorohydrolase [Streptococcus pneumoniae]|uniref:Chlorohydrolase n=1 Tax=Streptococcus pneumoniae TaxID=1313 RepID=A0A6I3UY12_STREE|nr:hypothetical protein [Streptococcus pneumoniae]EHZ58941.1 chlorohydrolase [Streptococcus pneumoniae GA47461]EJH12233.1 lysyl-tRNA synthetase [Streptococcus pneumoniae GA17484]MBW5164382.1 chlorohydrolase [Streptococcus pneumoniae]MBW7510188.1 chlorohydrolase [Streptococcus pneumoniae]MBW7517968.1 chlorohydrolase [Streptococcus pneumoniae]
MKIKEQTRKLAAGCSKHCFEVADESRRGLKGFSKSIKF